MILMNLQRTRRQGFAAELAILGFYWLCSAVLVPLCILGISRYLNSDAPAGAVISLQRSQ